MNTEKPAGAARYEDGLTPIPAVKFPLTDATKEELVRRFDYHAPHGDQAARYGEIRAQIRHLAGFICERAPISRELSTALTHLDAVMFYANAAIARNE